MTKEDFFKAELVKELRLIEVMIKKTDNVEKKIYYFSAGYGITSRTLRYTFSEDYLMADFVLNSCYNGIMDRFRRIRSGDSTVELLPIHFDKICEGLKNLADAFESNSSILKPLETILVATFSTSGPGNYLTEKGLIKL